MKRYLIASMLVLMALVGCNLPQASQKQVAPLEFPDLAPTYTPQLIFLPPETPVPEIITATPVTPAPTPATVSLQKLATWSQTEAYEAFWYPDSNRFAIVSPHELTLYRDSTAKKVWSAEPQGHQALFQAVSLSTNSNFIVTFNIGPAIHIYDGKEGGFSEKKRVLEECDGNGLLKSVYLSNGLKHLFTASQDPQKINAPVRIQRWKVAPYGCQLIDSITAGRFSDLLLSPDERHLVLVTQSGITGQVTAWNVSGGEKICSLQGTAAAFQRDGRLAVADMQKGALVYWRVEACQISSELPWDSYDEVQSLAFSPHGKYLLTFRRGIQIWDATTAGLLFERLMPEATSGGLLRLSPNGKYLLSISNPGALNAQVDFWALGE